MCKELTMPRISPSVMRCGDHQQLSLQLLESYHPIQTTKKSMFDRIGSHHGKLCGKGPCKYEIHQPLGG